MNAASIAFDVDALVALVESVYVVEGRLAGRGAHRIRRDVWVLFVAVSFAAAGCAKTPPSGAESLAAGADQSFVKQSGATQSAALTPAGATPTRSEVNENNSALNPAVKKDDFVAYWHELRRALSSADSESVARLTQFPFTVRGDMDSDPVRHIERGAFSALLRRLLAQDVGLSPKPEPLSQYLARMPEPPANAVQGETARIANMEFELRPEGWRFVGAYLGDSE